MRNVFLRTPAAVACVMLAACASLGASPPGATPTAEFDWFRYQGADPAPQAGPGEYRNPILQGFYPDPSITRDGDDYYFVSSTFAYFPGLPIFHSRDLVSWTQIGNAIDRPDQLDFKTLGLSRGVFAPSIDAHDGRFYILNTCVDCGGNFLISASNPAGPWSDPVWLPELDGGIDPAFFFDDDGKAWIVNNGPPPGQPLYDGHRAIWLQQFDLAASKLVGPRTMLRNGGVDISKKPKWIEGPHILKKDGFYYLVAAEGGTEAGHSQVVFRSRSVTGPYVPGPRNPILTQRDLPPDRPSPITSAGHADFVETAAGEWWASFLAVRPYKEDYYNTGRETFLLPVKWEDGWPRITGPRETIPYVHARPKLPPQPAPPVPTSGGFRVRDEFGGAALPPYWLMMRNPREKWWALDEGTLRLKPRPLGLGDMANPSFLARRQQHLNASASTAVRFLPGRDGDKAGLVALQNDDYWYFLGIAREKGRIVVRLDRRAGPNEPAGGLVRASAPLHLARGAPLYLRVDARGAAYDFYYATRPGDWRPLRLGEDGTLLSTHTAGGFVGAVFGVHAYAAHSP